MVAVGRDRTSPLLADRAEPNIVGEPRMSVGNEVQDFRWKIRHWPVFV